jgi:hypothetical protein
MESVRASSREEVMWREWPMAGRAGAAIVEETGEMRVKKETGKELAAGK